MTNVDYFVLWLVIGALFWVCHFLYFPNNLKKIYTGMTYITHKGHPIIEIPNVMILGVYVIYCVLCVRNLPS